MHCGACDDGITVYGVSGFLVDQDLTITRQKTLAINKAIHNLNLEVCEQNVIWSRTMDCDIISKSSKDLEFVMGTSTPGEKLWEPRVIVLLKREVEAGSVYS